MARALARGWGEPVLRDGLGLRPGARRSPPSSAARRCESNAEVAERADVVVLGHKPYQLERWRRRSPGTGEGRGLDPRRHVARRPSRAAYPGHARAYALMPNTPVEVGARRRRCLAAEDAADGSWPPVRRCSSRLGRSIDAARGAHRRRAPRVTGVGPPTSRWSPRRWSTPPSSAGCPRRSRRELVAETMAGTRRAARRPASTTRSRVRREVTSPGGVTARGLAALERGGLRAAFADAARRGAATARDAARLADARAARSPTTSARCHRLHADHLRLRPRDPALLVRRADARTTALVDARARLPARRVRALPADLPALPPAARPARPQPDRGDHRAPGRRRASSSAPIRG